MMQMQHTRTELDQTIPPWPPAALLAHPEPAISRLSHGDFALPAFSTIGEAVAHWVRLQPDAVAAQQGDRHLTYAELDRDADRLAAALIDAGVMPGDTVGIFVVRSLPMLVAILAVLKVGAAYVPQDVRISPPAVLLDVATQAGCRAVLGQRGTGHVIGLPTAISHLVIEDHMGGEGVHPPSLHCASRLPPACRSHPMGLCMVLFTSGTTGRPNGVQVSHRNLCNALLTSPGNLAMAPGMRVSQMMNIAFDMAAWEILGALCNGATLVLRGTDLQQTAAQVNVIVATPSMLARIDPLRCPHVRIVAVAGETCPAALAARWRQRCVFFNGCGPTETTIVNTMHRCDGRAGTVPIGRPTPNNTVYVLDSNLRPCAVNETGELWAGGQGVTQGYLGNPTLTRQRYRPDPFLGGDAVMFRTRDLGRWNSKGELEHLGRVDAQVKVSGFRVELDAVSRLLEAQPDITQAVTLKLDATTLVAFVTPATADVQRAAQHLTRNLPYYSVPRRLIARASLPLTTRGKIDTGALRQHVEAPGEDAPAAAATPASEDPLPVPLPLHRRWWHCRGVSHYNRLFAAACAVNMAVGVAHANDPAWWAAADASALSPASLALLNLAVAVLMRQSLVINLLFRVATCVPTHWPLAMRRSAAKVYHFGGLHSGCAVAALAWLSIAVLGLSRAPDAPPGALLSAAVLLGLWLAMAATALPALRRRFHDLFEQVHRLCGWASLIASGCLLLSLLPADATLATFVTTPSLWLLCLVMLSIALPWLRLRRVPVQTQRLSSHAIVLELERSQCPFPGSSNAISHHPFGQWHSFACIPTPGRHPFRLIVSRAGDWSGALIDTPPRHVWIRGFTTAGVANIETLFRRVVYVATGSGIGPVLPHLLAQRVPLQLIWSARSPRTTYGDALVDEILQAVPTARIWDTAEAGAPDLLALAWQAARQSGAEAVICIANQRVTRLVVEGCEARGLPAYGAIWDS